MKKIIAILLFTGISLSAFSQTKLIGELKNDKPIITINESELIKTFQANLLESSNIDAKFNSLSIIRYNSDYLLVFLGDKYKSAFYVTNQDNNLVVNNPKITCTTSDCASEQFGCIPTGDVTPSCTLCSNNGKCTKSVSNTSFLD